MIITVVKRFVGETTDEKMISKRYITGVLLSLDFVFATSLRSKSLAWAT